MTTAPSIRSTPAAGQVVTLHGEDELLARAGHLFNPSTEFICAATDLATWAATRPRFRVLPKIAQHNVAGVEVYKLYSASVLTREDDIGYLKTLAAYGAKVRICAAALPQETIIIDGRFAIVAGPEVAGTRDFNVITVPDVVSGVRALLMSTWQAATDLAEALPSPPPQLDEQGVAILRALSAGQKDETAARALGLSVRTYRRRVAELMDSLGASSRFQAGVRARELGLLV